MATKIEKDEITGTVTTGHEWDGIKELNYKGIGKHLVALNLTANNGKDKMYSDDDIQNAEADVVAQATGDKADDLMKRYPKAQARNFDGDPRITEMDALVAYLQMLGTLVDFSTFKAEVETESR